MTSATDIVLTILTQSTIATMPAKELKFAMYSIVGTKRGIAESVMSIMFVMIEEVELGNE